MRQCSRSVMAKTALPVLNIIGVFCVFFFSEVKGKPDLRAAVQSVKNHILHGVIIGFVFRSNIHYHSFSTKTVWIWRESQPPLAFLLLGGQFASVPQEKLESNMSLGVKLVTWWCSLW